LPISLLEEQVRSTQSNYVHPDGLFSLQIPMGWQVEEDVEYVEMTDPNANITVWVLAVDAMGLDASLNEALAFLNLGAEFAATSADVSSEDWTGEDVSVVYRNGSESDVLTVRARRPQKWTVVLLARGPERAIEALSENLQWIWSKLAIPADEVLLL
jgi:hypothetical protein